LSSGDGLISHVIDLLRDIVSRTISSMTGGSSGDRASVTVNAGEALTSGHTASNDRTSTALSSSDTVQSGNLLLLPNVGDHEVGAFDGSIAPIVTFATSCSTFGVELWRRTSWRTTDDVKRRDSVSDLTQL